MQVMNLKVILLMHVCHKLIPHMQIVIYPSSINSVRIEIE